MPMPKGQPQMLENLWPKLKPLLVAPRQTRKLACDTVVEGSSWKNIGSSRIRRAFGAEINVNEYPSLKEMIERGLAIHSVRDAYVQMGKAITFGELDVLSAQFGAFLQTSCGLKKGDRVAVMMPNILQYPDRGARRAARRASPWSTPTRSTPRASSSTSSSIPAPPSS